MNQILLQVVNPYHPLLYVLVVWSIAWKGVALWHAARGKQRGWYITLLVVNTAGILEIVYLLFFRKKTMR